MAWHTGRCAMRPCTRLDPCTNVNWLQSLLIAPARSFLSANIRRHGPLPSASFFTTRSFDFSLAHNKS